MTPQRMVERELGRREGLEEALHIVRRFAATYRALDSGAEPFTVVQEHFSGQAAACMEIAGDINKALRERNRD